MIIRTSSRYQIPVECWNAKLKVCLSWTSRPFPKTIAQAIYSVSLPKLRDLRLRCVYQYSHGRHYEEHCRIQTDGFLAAQAFARVQAIPLRRFIGHLKNLEYLPIQCAKGMVDRLGTGYLILQTCAFLQSEIARKRHLVLFYLR